jgi:Cof subfamily protein (haloacid dehalogenase superfamily)
MKIFAVCTDIDGTLLDSRRQLSIRTLDAINRVNRANVPLILASSRMPSAMRHLQVEMGIGCQPMICFNGGYVIYEKGEPPSTVILDSVHIPLAVCTAIGRLARGTEIHVSLYAEDQWYAPLEDQWTLREATITKVQPEILEFEQVMTKWEGLRPGAHKVMCMGPESEIEALYIELQKKFTLDLHLYRSRPTYLEIAPKAISKATALALVMKNVFNSDLSGVLAFGDNYNDIDMIRDAGLGISVGNAIQQVKDVAKEVTLNSKEDGVAIAIEKYFPE